MAALMKAYLRFSSTFLGLEDLVRVRLPLWVRPERGAERERPMP